MTRAATRAAADCIGLPDFRKASEDSSLEHCPSARHLRARGAEQSALPESQGAGQVWPGATPEGAALAPCKMHLHNEHPCGYSTSACAVARGARALACMRKCVLVAWTAARIRTLCIRAMRSVVQKRTYVNDAYDWVPSPYVRRQKKTSAAHTCMLADVRANTLARKCLCSCMSVTARRAASVLHIVQALHARLATRTWRTSRPTSPRRACARLSPRLR